MFYFSEIIGKKIHTKGKQYLGTLTDLIFVNQEVPSVTKIVYRTPSNNHETVPVTAVTKINSTITLVDDPGTAAVNQNELSVARHLLDKQIIDLVGNKVVRVNDVAIQDKPTYYVSGIDIGFMGILRRLGMADPLLAASHAIKRDIQIKLLSWAEIQNLELESGQIKLKQREDKLSHIHAEDLADYLELTNTKNARRFLKTLEDQRAADVLSSLNAVYQADLFESLEPEHAAKLISLIDPDEAADILLSTHLGRREHVLAALDEKTREELIHLMNLSELPIGQLLTTDFLNVSPNATARDIIEKIRRDTSDFSSLTIVYVSNETGNLVGVFTLHELLLQRPENPVYKFMTQNPIIVHLTTPIEIVVKKMLRYKLSAIPVIDKHRRMVGIVTSDDIADHLLQKVS